MQSEPSSVTIEMSPSAAGAGVTTGSPQATPAPPPTPAQLEVVVAKKPVEQELKATVLPNLNAYGGPGATIAARLEAARNALPVFIVGKSWCPFCLSAIQALLNHGAAPTVLNIDVIADGAAVHAELKQETKQATVPYIFIGGRLVGGCSDVKSLEAAGELDALLSDAGALSLSSGEGGVPLRARDVRLPHGEPPAASPDAPRVFHAMFNFPDTVDGHVIRAVALQVVAVSIAIVVLRGRPEGQWLSVALLIDFLLRFLAGSAASPLGVIAMTAVARMRPSMSAGPPKQFAAFVGLCFSGAGTAALWADNSSVRVGGAIVWAVLAAFAALEGFLNFCAGCWVFGKAIQMGILPDTAYAIHVNKQGEMLWMWDENMGRHDTPAPAATPVAAIVDAEGSKPSSQTAIVRQRQTWASAKPMRTDVTVRVGKDDAAKRRDWNLVKHVRVGFFNMSLSLTGLAYVWRAMALGVAKGTDVEIRTPDLVWQILIIFAGVVWVTLAVLLVAKIMNSVLKVLVLSPFGEFDFGRR